jgi:hypothetical protein
MVTQGARSAGVEKGFCEDLVLVSEMSCLMGFSRRRKEKYKQISTGSVEDLMDNDGEWRGYKTRNTRMWAGRERRWLPSPFPFFFLKPIAVSCIATLLHLYVLW